MSDFENSLTIVMAQFGDRRRELQPSLSSFRRYFPEAVFRLYTDERFSCDGVDVRQVKVPFSGYRRYNRTNNHYKLVGLIDADTDIAIAIDSDMDIVSADVRMILDLTRRFGACVPSNSRFIVKNDARVGIDGCSMPGPAGVMHAMNFTPISFLRGHEDARRFLVSAIRESETNPTRGPVIIARAVWSSGFQPCLLPPQWCLCAPDVGIKDEIILHVGHEVVQKKYGNDSAKRATIITAGDCDYREIIARKKRAATRLLYGFEAYDLGGLGEGTPYEVNPLDIADSCPSGYPPCVFKPEIIRDAIRKGKDGDNFAWLDGDTVLRMPLDEVFRQNFHVGVCLKHGPQPSNKRGKFINAGVIFFRKNKVTMEFLDAWCRLSKEVENDQFALRLLTKAGRNFKNVGKVVNVGGLDVFFLPCRLWNDYNCTEQGRIWHFKDGGLEEYRKSFGLDESSASVVVCTAIFGGRSELWEPKVVGNARYVCFSDRKHDSKTWEVIVVPPKGRPVMQAKKYKLQMHRFFPDADYLVWVDGNMELTRPLTPGELEVAMGDSDIAMHAHKKRNCLYKEAKACSGRRADIPRIIAEQVTVYQSSGVPENYGLHYGGFIIRRNKPLVNEMFDMWWKEVQLGSIRDQISLPYCRWKTGVRVRSLSSALHNSYYFQYHYHSVLVAQPDESDKKVIIYDSRGDHVWLWLSGLVRYLRDNYDVRIIAGSHFYKRLTWRDKNVRGRVLSEEEWREELKGCVHALMWGGDSPSRHTLKNVCDEVGVSWSVVENAWFPQSKYWFVDSKGINANSSLMDDDLSWVGPEHLERLKQFRKDYGKGKNYKPQGYVLVPLQVERDTNIKFHSPFQTMQDFVRHCEKKFAGRQLAFKLHPKDPKVRLKGNGKSQLIQHGSFVDIAMGASLVYGINSTCLLEAALLGVPVESIGEGFLKRHADKREKLLAALVDKQIPVGEHDLDYWIKPRLEAST